MAISPTDNRILFNNYDIITYFLNLAFCSEHFISIKHRILATFNINKKINSNSLYAFNTQVHDRSPYWFDTGTSIKSVGIKLQNEV